jgi:hypothetical protein
MAKRWTFWHWLLYLHRSRLHDLKSILWKNLLQYLHTVRVSKEFLLKTRLDPWFFQSAFENRLWKAESKTRRWVVYSSHLLTKKRICKRLVWVALTFKIQGWFCKIPKTSIFCPNLYEFDPHFMHIWSGEIVPLKSCARAYIIQKWKFF